MKIQKPKNRLKKFKLEEQIKKEKRSQKSLNEQRNNDENK